LKMGVKHILTNYSFSFRPQNISLVLLSQYLASPGF
jgi:hypothetical protein